MLQAMQSRDVSTIGQRFGLYEKWDVVEGSETHLAHQPSPDVKEEEEEKATATPLGEKSSPAERADAPKVEDTRDTLPLEAPAINENPTLTPSHSQSLMSLMESPAPKKKRETKAADKAETVTGRSSKKSSSGPKVIITKRDPGVLPPKELKQLPLTFSQSSSILTGKRIATEGAGVGGSAGRNATKRIISRVC